MTGWWMMKRGECMRVWAAAIEVIEHVEHKKGYARIEKLVISAAAAAVEEETYEQEVADADVLISQPIITHGHEPQGETFTQSFKTIDIYRVSIRGGGKYMRSSSG